MNINSLAVQSAAALTQTAPQAAVTQSGAQANPPGAVAASALAPAAASQTTSVTASVQSTQAISRLEDLQKIAQKIRDALPSAAYYGLDFSVDKELDRLIIRVVEQGSGKLIRQIPSEEALQIASAIERQINLLSSQA